MKVRLYSEEKALEEEVVYVRAVPEVGEGKGLIKLVLVNARGENITNPYICSIVVKEGKLELHRYGHANNRFVRWDDRNRIKTR